MLSRFSFKACWDYLLSPMQECESTHVESNKCTYKTDVCAKIIFYSLGIKQTFIPTTFLVGCGLLAVESSLNLHNYGVLLLVDLILNKYKLSSDRVTSAVTSTSTGAFS